MASTRPKGDRHQPRVRLTRSALEADVFRRINAAADSPIEMLSEAARTASLERALADLAAAPEVWVFGYGSLIWNPGFEPAEVRRGTIYGYHRRFCIWTRLGRGTPARPGLLLGLDRGGACSGLLLRISEACLRRDLEHLWRREMNTTAYLVRSFVARTAGGPVRAFTFVANRESDHYAPAMPLPEVARTIAGAEGVLGPCVDYLAAARQAFERYAIRDPTLRRIEALLRAGP